MKNQQLKTWYPPKNISLIQWNKKSPGKVTHCSIYTNVVFKDPEIMRYVTMKIQSPTHDRQWAIFMPYPGLEIIAFSSLRQIIHSKTLNRGRSSVLTLLIIELQNDEFLNTLILWRLNMHNCDYYIHLNFCQLFHFSITKIGK